MSENNYPKLHNAMWPGLVGKKSMGGDEADISLDQMLDLTAKADTTTYARRKTWIALAFRSSIDSNPT